MMRDCLHTHTLASQLECERLARQELARLVAGTRVEQLAAARARVAQLDARLAQIEVDLRDSVLRAPYAGVVGALELDPTRD